MELRKTVDSHTPSMGRILLAEDVTGRSQPQDSRVVSQGTKRLGLRTGEFANINSARDNAKHLLTLALNDYNHQFTAVFEPSGSARVHVRRTISPAPAVHDGRPAGVQRPCGHLARSGFAFNDVDSDVIRGLIYSFVTIEASPHTLGNTSIRA